MMKVLEIEGADGATVRPDDESCLRDGTRGFDLLAPTAMPTPAPIVPTAGPSAEPTNRAATEPTPAPGGSDGAAARATTSLSAAAALALLLA